MLYCTLDDTDYNRVDNSYGSQVQTNNYSSNALIVSSVEEANYMTSPYTQSMNTGMETDGMGMGMGAGGVSYIGGGGNMGVGEGRGRGSHGTSMVASMSGTVSGGGVAAATHFQRKVCC